MRGIRAAAGTRGCVSQEPACHAFLNATEREKAGGNAERCKEWIHQNDIRDAMVRAE